MFLLCAKDMGIRTAQIHKAIPKMTSTQQRRERKNVSHLFIDDVPHRSSDRNNW